MTEPVLKAKWPAVDGANVVKKCRAEKAGLIIRDGDGGHEAEWLK